ncbi:ABC transporter ATP-binding protein [Aetokthonos hydrillicola Thurmond2011]|jgi:zinc/manganese transport system ATP-binding protein|uniref:ABC transporter ATP-binding protein n=1 Tax=Aetokthonos hydrillicola Thurmond2011 TaxID=2712845 RepID=A0AAP5IG67_9CYAN|nr:ABC transporter ATP-binding protein [Aetokthonos hydrillicola]MBO3461990.1 ABC transporter ATP-binding protein [Aetokthonos hydrillicola CCALA 1050]MBW4584307.1 ABC transporter ATP-binding protein [Aetokthonos hydrillicola CCALA 1050]MDR9898485.1 ABC transporter ATP-binding protein [Aetokthonos hydrillicola Thurmond2011]
MYNVIQFEHAGIRRGGRLLWSNLHNSVQKGEFIAILGPNGAGKSTLLKVLLGFLPLTEGQVTILGSPVRRGNPSISYLPQRRNFDVDMRIRGRDIVQLGLDGTKWGVPLPLLRRLWGGDVKARESQRSVQNVIDLVGATSYANRPIGELSGGEQQRLLIAQALVTKPRILLLDEPLDSLDLYNQQSVSALIRHISQKHQVTVLLVAHDVNPILPYIDRVLYMGGGQIEIGKPEEVITSETLSRLYDAPIDVLRTRDGRIVVIGQPESVTYHVNLSHHAH